MNKDPYALFYDIYQAHYDHALKEIYLDAIQTHAPRGRVLEMGCGPAFIGIALTQLGYDVLATDISEDFLTQAQKNATTAGCDLAVAAHNILDPIPFDVDHVVMGFDVINHLETLDQFDQALRHIYEALPDGGMLFFDVLQCAYIQTMVGHVEELTTDGGTLEWRITHGPYPCSFRHRLKRDDRVITLNQRSFDAQTMATLLSRFTWVDHVSLSDRTVYILKK